MIEINATSGVLPSVLQHLHAKHLHHELPAHQQQQQLPPLEPADITTAYNVDANPINLQDFLDIASAGDFTHSIYEFAANVSSSTLSTTASGIYGNESTFFPSFNSTLHDSVPNLPKSELQCADAYAFTWHSAAQIEVSRLEFWVCGILLNFLGLLGILGNIISMIILSRPQMRSSINYLLIGLARVDTALIITSILLFGIPSIYPYTGAFFFYHNNIYPFIAPVVYPLALMSQTASIYMTFTVTLERYVAVCHPLKARALCTYGRAKIYFIACVLFAILYNLPHFWEVRTASNLALHENDLVLNCVLPTELRSNKAYMSIYIHWCYLIVNYIVPFLTLAILNCLIYRQVKLANRERQRLSRSEKREIGLATMLLCVVIIFFIFNFLALVLNISEVYYDYIDTALTKISNLLITVNSGANFLIYVIFGEKFKRIFLLIFFKRRLSRDQPDLIHYESSISNNGDGTLNRSSVRFSRHGTQRSTTTTYLTTSSGSNTLNNVRSISPSLVKIKRSRAPSPGPVVYYPARNLQRSSSAVENTAVLLSNNNAPLNCDWTSLNVSPNSKSGHMTSGF